MRRVVLAAVLLIATPMAASATETPGTARYAVQDRGEVAIVPSPPRGGLVYLPATGPRTFTLFARLRAPVARRPVAVLVRHAAASHRCAASYAADAGTPLAFGPAMPDSAGYVTLVSREVQWRRTGNRRFCVWMTTKPRARVRPASSVVRFFAHGTGGVQLATRDSYGLGTLTFVVSTDPYSLSISDTGCPPDRTRDYGLLATRAPWTLIPFTSFDSALPGCNRRVAFSVTGSSAGTLTLDMDMAQAAAGLINHAGGMCTLPNVNETVADARALVIAQGCRVGREIAADKTSGTPGRVWTYSVNGARAWLVPRGTRVDLAVDP